MAWRYTPEARSTPPSGTPTQEATPSHTYSQSPATGYPARGVGLGLFGWRWRPNARKDMQALYWTPGSNDRTESLVVEDEFDKDVREERREIRRHNARKRLDWMRTAHVNGKRFADIVEEAYGKRGEALNARMSASTFIGDHFAIEGERDAFRIAMQRDNPHISPDRLDAMEPLAFGNALIIASETAYNAGKWCEVIPPEAPVEQSAAEKRWREVAARWATQRVDMLEADTLLSKHTTDTQPPEETEDE